MLTVATPSGDRDRYRKEFQKVSNHIPVQTLHRLPIYLSLLKKQQKFGIFNISSGAIAAELGFGEIQVRKDLASVSNGGKPRVGYLIRDLINDIECALGYGNMNNAVLVGAGKLGKALMSYEGFREYGINIVAAFDASPEVYGSEYLGKKILSVDMLKEYCASFKIRMGVITVPAEYAQSVCNSMVDAGILAIWNFAPTHLKAPENIMIKTENMAASLAMLSKHLAERINAE